MFERTIKLIGEMNLNKIKSKTICVIGLGGVGGSACEALIRSGVENIIIVDYDTIDITNLNRQIITNNKKVLEMEKRIKSINNKCKVTIIDSFINKDNINLIFDNNIDYLIDACDSVSTKELLISNCLEKDIKLISCMGTGNKLDPTKLEITDIRKTSYDPLAKKIRKYVVDNKIKGKVPVVYSKETNAKFKGSIPSMIFVPSVAGIMCANYVICDIINN